MRAVEVVAADTARRVEDKLLERGSLKRYLGTTEYGVRTLNCPGRCG